MKKVVSVTKARKILGGASTKLTDTQIRETIINLQLLAKQQLFYNGSKENVAGHEPKETQDT